MRCTGITAVHDDVIKRKHFSRYWPFVRGIHRSQWIPHKKASDVFFDLRLNKRLSKQWWGWWFETLSCPLWRHRDVSACRVYIQDLNLVRTFPADILVPHSAGPSAGTEINTKLTICPSGFSVTISCYLEVTCRCYSRVQQLQKYCIILSVKVVPG